MPLNDGEIFAGFTSAISTSGTARSEEAEIDDEPSAIEPGLMRIAPVIIAGAIPLPEARTPNALRHTCSDMSTSVDSVTVCELGPRLLELRGWLSRRYEAEFGVKLEPQIGMVAEGGGHPAWHA